MIGAWVVARRELAGMFGSPAVLFVAAAFHLWNGLVYRRLVVDYVEACRDATGSGALPSTAIADAVLAPLCIGLAFGLILFLPLLTMRTLAEERRSGFEDLLLSLPLTPASVILGKFFAMLVLVVVLAWPPLLVALGLWGAGSLDPGVLASAGLGLLLAGAAYAAVGLCASALTSQPVAAGVGSLTVLLLLFFADGFWTPAGVVSLRQAFDPFARGVIGLEAIGVHVLAASLFLFLAIAASELRRRRQ